MTWDWSDDDRVALAEFLERHGIGAGPVTTRRIGDGHSNLTYLVTGPDTRVVVRRPPPPPVPPGAHDVLREARILSGIVGHGVPVPRVLASARVGELLPDSPLYVMTHVDGPVVTTETPPPLATPRERRAIAESFVDTLAALHTVDPAAATMPDKARARGSNARQLRIRRLLGDEPASGIDEIGAWLGQRVPDESGAAIVHNDYRLGNVVLMPDAPGRIAAVLDWELAALGDPLVDLGYVLATWPAAGSHPNAVAAMGTAVQEPGYLSRDELVDRYRRSIEREVPDLRWYRVLALWKLAVLFDYNRRRTLAGHGDPYYADPGRVDSFLDEARALVQP